MQHEIIPLGKNAEIAHLKRFIQEDDADRPAMLVIPGGGYGCICDDTEGYPIAEKFAGLGFRTFMLRYHLTYPAAQEDALCAIKTIRENAGLWHVRPDNIAVCGFSAGAHLAASAGTLFEELADCTARPDAMVLCYPVISLETPDGHPASGRNLLGTRYDELCGTLSLQNRVTGRTPPAFIWHTVQDQMVPVANSLLMAQSMMRHHILCALHLYPEGPHGMQLGYGRRDIATWPEEAKTFLHESCAFRFPPPPRFQKRKIVLTFDDACKNHLTYVAPLLKKYGFHATFFITRFTDAWRAEHGAALLDAADLRTLEEMGFEIGHHFWSHAAPSQCTPAQCRAELERLNDFLAAAGVRRPVSFAYPGGPFAANLAPLLPEYGFACARTTEPGVWDHATEPMRIPATPLQGGYELSFYQAVSHATEDAAQVLVFHGVPDLVHPHVDTPPEVLQKYLKYLYEHDYEVLSMSDWAFRGEKQIIEGEFRKKMIKS